MEKKEKNNRTCDEFRIEKEKRGAVEEEGGGGREKKETNE